MNLKDFSYQIKKSIRNNKTYHKPFKSELIKLYIYFSVKRKSNINIYTLQKNKNKNIFRFCDLSRSVFSQSFPVHPVSESRGIQKRDGRSTKLLVSFIFLILQKKIHLMTFGERRLTFKTTKIDK